MVSNDANKIRVSIGTAVAIGLNSRRVRVLPKTAYLMTFSKEKCMENCLFCVQARTSKVSQNHLSRIIWPEYELNKVAKALSLAVSSGKIKRICIQTIKTQNIIEDLIYQLKILSKAINKKVPLSVAIHPIEIDIMKKMRDLGVTDLSISFDAVTPEIFDKVKGKYVGNSYTWEGHWRGLLNAIKVFGKWHVNTHIIIGLGEKEVDIVRFLQDMVDLNVTVGIMALTPVKGTGVENYASPPIDKYRRIQLAYYLIRKGFASFNDFKFDSNGRIVDFGVSKSKLFDIIRQGYPFMTVGCPFCDRPYYNEKPRGPLYNYPFKPTSKDIKNIEEEVNVKL